MPVPRISRREQLHAALRPAEAVELRLSDCDLPETGWGTLTLRETPPVSGKQWADSGERHDRRGLAVRGGQPQTAQSPSRPSWFRSSGLI